MAEKCKREISGELSDAVGHEACVIKLNIGETIVVKRILLILGALIVVATGWMALRRHIPSEMDYQGQKIKLSKYYLSYEDYKDDPENIDPSENGRVERLVSGAPIGSRFEDRKELVHAIWGIKFPGYGLGALGEHAEQDGSVLALYEVEIPRAAKNRYFTFEGRNHTYVLIDDFVASERPQISQVRKEHENLIYSSRDGQAILTRPIAKNSQ